MSPEEMTGNSLDATMRGTALPDHLIDHYRNPQGAIICVSGGLTVSTGDGDDRHSANVVQISPTEQGRIIMAPIAS